MGNLPKTVKEPLPEFQNFLREKGLAPEKNIPFLAYWVKRFLDFAKAKDLDVTNFSDTVISAFVEALRAERKILDWQPRQADDAIKLYYFHYLGKTRNIVGGLSTDVDNETVTKEISRLIRLRHYSLSTERTYISWVERFLSFSLKSGKKKIADLTPQDFRDFITYLALTQRVAASTQNQAFNALLFLFRHVLGKETGDLGAVIRAKRGLKLPVVFSVEEVKQLLSEMDGTSLLIAQILYGSGLRLMEVMRLRVKDIDFAANTIIVRSGKGDKDRSTVLPLIVKHKLKEHLQRVKRIHERDLASGHGESNLPYALTRKYPNAGKEWAWQYVFPSSKLSIDPHSGRVGRYHIDPSTIQSAVKKALTKTGIPKHASVHTLRHYSESRTIPSELGAKYAQPVITA
jgi:integron integrase